MKITANVTFPMLVKANDYHEFSFLSDILTQATGQKVSYEEIEDSFGVVLGADLSITQRSGYHALFWVGEKDKQIRDELAEIQASCYSCDEEE